MQQFTAGPPFPPFPPSHPDFESFIHLTHSGCRERERDSVRVRVKESEMGAKKKTAVAASAARGLWERATLPENLFCSLWAPSSDPLVTVGTTDSEEVTLLAKATAEARETQEARGAARRWAWTALVWTFVLFTLYQIGYGTLHNVVFCLRDSGLLEGAADPVHHFQYGLVATYLDFGRQSHWVLLAHSLSAGPFLMACLVQTSSVERVLFSGTASPAVHRRLGLFTLLCSALASSTAWLLSFRALYDTEIIYLLGTSIWLLCTAMALVRAKQRRWIAHSRWAATLQELGIMFTTTRVVAPICLRCGLTTADSYFWGVWGAGASAVVMLFFGERRRLRVTRLILERDGLSTAQAAPLVASSAMGFLGMAMGVAIVAVVFVGAPLLRFTQVLEFLARPFGLPLTAGDVVLFCQALVVVAYLTVAFSTHSSFERRVDSVKQKAH